MLKTGSKGSDVSRLQQRLSAAGFAVRGSATAFGKMTKSAVIAFQKANGLKADGIVGPKTAKKLFGSRDTKYFDGKSDFTAGQGPRGAKGSGSTGTTRGSGVSGRPSSEKSANGGASGVGVPASSVRGSDALVRNIQQVEREMPGTGRCAKAVNEAIHRTFGIRTYGHANQLDSNLPKSKFKQVDMTLEQALKVKGAVLTWESTNTRLGAKYGHTAITTGDGKTSISDYAERDTIAGSNRMGRKGLKVFIPT